MARITVEDCIDKVSTRFELVLIASRRARKLHTGEQSTLEKANDKNTVIALREIAEEAIHIDDLKENLIDDYRTVVMLDEDKDSSNLDLYDENIENKDEISSEIANEVKSLELVEKKELEEQYVDENDVNQDDSEKIVSDSHEENDVNQNDSEKIVSDSHEDQN